MMVRWSSTARFLIQTALLLVVPVAADAQEWRSKVDPWVLEAAKARATVDFLVLLDVQADLTAANRMGDRFQRRRYVIERLRDTAAAAQVELVERLTELGVPHRPFWIANMVWVEGDFELARALAERRDVVRIHANPRIRAALPETGPETARESHGVEWNLVRMGAPDFWSHGFSGQGVVIGGQDTGYEWNHPALQSRYRGWNGVTASHDYNWHDSIHTVGAGSDCGADSPEPCDGHGHGTHTMGIMIGDDGGSNQIGVAPGAQWIGCRNMDENGVGSPATYAECFEFFVAPTRLDGSDPNPDLAPDVINNSWTCPPAEGCSDPDVLRTVVRNVRAAGIVVVASAGNDGPGCGSITAPPAIYESALTVGSTDLTDNVWSGSSRGSVLVDGSERLKPNVTAPGVGIRSCIPGGGYGTLTGTSMAGPHVAGQVALLISAVPQLAGRVESLESCIEQTAVPLTSDQECSGISGSQVPNNTAGRGRIELSLPLPGECSETFVFADDFENGQPSGWD